MKNYFYYMKYVNFFVLVVGPDLPKGTFYDLYQIYPEGWRKIDIIKAYSV